jgi:hypothetical protein
MAVVLALLVGFFLYRVALVAVPTEQYVGTTKTCAEGGSVPRPLFDALTGLPGGVVYSCANEGSHAAIAWGPMELELLGGHWGRAALYGLSGAVLAFMVLWWAGRRRRMAVQPS